MSEHAHFAGDWLALREPLDHACRSPALTARAAQRLAAATQREKVIVDLGSGSGSNLRYLAPRLPGPQRWRLLDHDPALLESAGKSGCHDAQGMPLAIDTRVTDLADPRWHARLDGADLVTAAALFDLVTPAWIDELAWACARRRLPVLFALSVDGAIDLQPQDDEDRCVLDLLQAHQARDKSFGAALGTSAPAAMRRAFERMEYDVHMAGAVWLIDKAEHAAVGVALVEGWRDAAIEQSPADSRRIARWAERRCAQLRAGALRITVGHRDLFAAPRAVPPA